MKKVTKAKDRIIETEPPQEPPDEGRFVVNRNGTPIKWEVGKTFFCNGRFSVSLCSEDGKKTWVHLEGFWDWYEYAKKHGGATE